MKLKAYAKINISLDIVGTRDDGYHLLRMIMQSIDLYDIIDLNEIENGIELKCDKKYIPTDSRNIAYKAAKIFIDTYKINKGVSIEIKKNIPTAAGLGGGSSDGAAVLKGMREIFNPTISDKELENLALKVGADVPFLINGGTALCEGIGERIKPLKAFKDKIIVLVKPNFGVSTKQVYKEYDSCNNELHPNTDELILAIEKDNIKFICENMGNVLEAVTIKNNPMLEKVKKNMIKFGAIGTMMSGSGPSIFAFFEDSLSAQKCFEKMKEDYPQTFITRTI